MKNKELSQEYDELKKNNTDSTEQLIHLINKNKEI